MIDKSEQQHQSGDTREQKSADTAAAGRQGPLTGMRVIELAHIMAGPVCGMMLADMGADVIKVEKAAGGDDTRRFLPPAIEGESAAFMMMNRNKRGVSLDLKQPGGRDALLRLVKGADVLIENYRHDTMEKLGLDYETLKSINPALIYCEISGFGRTGPYRERGGFDLIAQGMSGLMSVTGPDVSGDETGTIDEPVKIGPPVSDITAGILAAMGACAAYANRLQTGQGNRVDTSLFEAGITHTFWQSAIAFAGDETPRPLGSAHPLNAPYQAIATRDGYINLGAANQTNWLKLLDVIGAPSLAEDKRFATNADRMQHRRELIEELTTYFKQRDAQDWVERLNSAGVPAGPLLDIRQMHADPQTRSREMVTTVDHPIAGTVETLGAPVKFHETPLSVNRAAPLLGQHTRDVLRECDYSDTEIDALLASGAAVTTQ